MSSNNNKSNELRTQIIEEMEARRIDHKTYVNAKWLLDQYDALKDQAHKAEVEAIKDTFICNRVGVHTCRASAIHIPFRFCGKIKDLLTTSPESDKTEDLSSKK